MLIDLNGIGRGLFRINKGGSKLDLSLTELKRYNGDLVSKIRNENVHNFTESHEKAIDFLKVLFEYCYLNNIDLNKYIILSLNDEEI